MAYCEGQRSNGDSGLEYRVRRNWVPLIACFFSRYHNRTPVNTPFSVTFVTTSHFFWDEWLFLWKRSIPDPPWAAVGNCGGPWPTATCGRPQGPNDILVKPRWHCIGFCCFVYGMEAKGWDRGTSIFAYSGCSV